MKESTGYLGDRVEIDDLLTRYASAIDTREWDLLDSVFTADADAGLSVRGRDQRDLP